MNGLPWRAGKHRANRLFYVFSLVALMLLSLTQQVLWLDIVTLSCLVWLGGFVSIILHPRTSAMYRSRWFVASLVGFSCYAPGLGLLTLVQVDNGRLWVFWLFLLTTATDVGAFFLVEHSGKMLSRRKSVRAKQKRVPAVDSSWPRSSVCQCYF